MLSLFTHSHAILNLCDWTWNIKGDILNIVLDILFHTIEVNGAFKIQKGCYPNPCVTNFLVKH